MSKVGLHIRNIDSFENVLKTALEKKLDIFQTFFISKMGQNFNEFSYNFQNNFLKNYKDKFSKIYIHAPYNINLTYGQYSSQPSLKRELKIMNQLELTDIIFHPGGLKNNSSSISASGVARLLNYLIKNNSDIIFHIENTAFGNSSFASNLKDFNEVFKNLDCPERVNIVIDTAHAYSYGYDIDSNFVDILKELPKNSISLIHLNDSGSLKGQKVDIHADIGQGNIGIENLKSFVQNQFIKNMPIILELPNLDNIKEIETLNKIKSWLT